MNRVQHDPRCNYLQEPPTLRDPNDCNCGAIPPLTQGRYDKQAHVKIAASDPIVTVPAPLENKIEIELSRPGKVIINPPTPEQLENQLARVRGHHAYPPCFKCKTREALPGHLMCGTCISWAEVGHG